MRPDLFVPTSIQSVIAYMDLSDMEWMVNWIERHRSQLKEFTVTNPPKHGESKSAYVKRMKKKYEFPKVIPLHVKENPEGVFVNAWRIAQIPKQQS